MRDNEPLYAVGWIDLLLGVQLGLKYPDARTALEARDRIERDGVGKVTDVQAIYQANALAPIQTLQPCD